MVLFSLMARLGIWPIKGQVCRVVRSAGESGHVWLMGCTMRESWLRRVDAIWCRFSGDAGGVAPLRLGSGGLGSNVTSFGIFRPRELRGQVCLLTTGLQLCWQDSFVSQALPGRP